MSAARTKLLVISKPSTPSRFPALLVSGNVDELPGMVGFVSLHVPDDKLRLIVSRLVPLYPLRPIYSVFSNIVATSDPLDLKLLQDTANGLDSLAQNHASMKAVHKLCSSLIELCATFFKNTEASQTIHPSQFGLMGPAPGHVPEREGPRQQSRPKNVAHNSGGRATPLQNHSFGGHITQEQPMFAVKDYSQGKYHFDDDLDWELFCAQPSLDFFDLGDQ